MIFIVVSNDKYGTVKTYISNTFFNKHCNNMEVGQMYSTFKHETEVKKRTPLFCAHD